MLTAIAIFAALITWFLAVLILGIRHQPTFFLATIPAFIVFQVVMAGWGLVLLLVTVGLVLLGIPILVLVDRKKHPKKNPPSAT